MHLTKKMLLSLSDEEFACLMLRETLDAIKNQASPTAVKLRHAIQTIHQYALDKSLPRTNWWELRFYDSNGKPVPLGSIDPETKDNVQAQICKDYPCGSWMPKMEG